MRPLSDRKSCEQHLIAHFQWGFLRFRIEFFHSVFALNLPMNFCNLGRQMAKACQWVSLSAGDAHATILYQNVALEILLGVFVE